MHTLMLQFKHLGPPPSAEEVCRMFNLKPDEIETQFGIIATDPVEGIYTVLVDTTASGRVEAVLAARPSDPAEGIFANPRIEPFGPPDK